VWSADSQCDSNSLRPEELDDAATLLRGTPRGFSMVQDLDASYDATLFVGYHERAGTPRAILDHTYNGTIAAVQVNGTEVGETGINAYLAGHHGVPVVLVTGDRAVTAEAKALIPTVRRVGGLRFEFEADDYLEAFRTFYAMVTIAGGD